MHNDFRLAMGYQKILPFYTAQLYYTLGWATRYLSHDKFRHDLTIQSALETLSVLHVADLESVLHVADLESSEAFATS